MTLFFGRLTQDFVAFSQALSRADEGIPGAASQVATEAANFRHSAALNATYLVYTGELPMSCIQTSLLTLCPRNRHLGVHLHLHERLGVYRRSQREAYS